MLYLTIWLYVSTVKFFRKCACINLHLPALLYTGFPAFSQRQRKETGLLLLPDATVPFSSEEWIDRKKNGIVLRFNQSELEIKIRLKGYDFPLNPGCFFHRDS